MIKISQAVIVEGKYDKIKLSALIDGLIITTDGFGVFKDKEKIQLIKELAKNKGIIILTDSDRAGFKIRNYIKGFVNDGKIINVYIPEIKGKEKRKSEPSKEGKLGVEGVSLKILEDAFKKAGALISEGSCAKKNFIDKIRLYDDGFIGGEDSAFKRRALLSELNLPCALSVNSMIEVLNTMYTSEEYEIALKKIQDKPEEI